MDGKNYGSDITKVERYREIIDYTRENIFKNLKILSKTTYEDGWKDKLEKLKNGYIVQGFYGNLGQALKEDNSRKRIVEFIKEIDSAENRGSAYKKFLKYANIRNAGITVLSTLAHIIKPEWFIPINQEISEGLKSSGHIDAELPGRKDSKAFEDYIELLNRIKSNIQSDLDAIKFSYNMYESGEKDGKDDDKYAKAKDILSFKKQIILYGPPGTGKTFQARRIATSFITGSSKDFEEKYKELEKNGQIRFITFHPTYSYEEFVEGYRPTDDGNFKLKDGIFKEICEKAFNTLCKSGGIDKTWKDYFVENKSELDKEYVEKIQNNNDMVEKYVIIIDEINRGNISKIFGELITLLEPDKRIGGKSQTIVTLPYSKERFGVPPNLYIIGTMNTADRSIALVDIALRRRFGFVEIPPADEDFYEILEEASEDAPDGKIDRDTAIEGLNGLDISELLKAMNMRITFLADREKQIGHAYFLNVFRDENGEYVKDEDLWKENLHRIWYNEIIPLLQEYFYNDYEKIKKVLGEDENNDGFIEKIRKDNTVKDYVPEDVERYGINHDNKELYSENFDEFAKALNRMYKPENSK